MACTLRRAAALVFIMGLIGLFEVAALVVEGRLAARAVLALGSVPVFLLVAWVHGHIARAARLGRMDDDARRAALLLVPFAALALAGAALLMPRGWGPHQVGPLVGSLALAGCAGVAATAWAQVHMARPDAPWHRIPARARDRMAARRLCAALALTAVAMFCAAVFLAGAWMLLGTGTLWTAAVPALLGLALLYLWHRGRRLFALREDVHALGHEARGLALAVVPLLGGILLLALEVPALDLQWIPAWVALAATAICLAVAADPLVRLGRAGA